MTSGLVHRCVFGANGQVSNGVAYAEDGSVLYVAGHNVVVLDPAEKRQRFIHGAEGYTGITALAVCPSRHFVAVAEAAADKPSVHVYDLRTLRIRKKLQHPDLDAHKYVALSFSHDDNLLLTQSAGPAWTLICWSWAKVRPLCAVRISDGPAVRQVGFSPADAALACACGDGIVRFYRFLDGAARALPPPKADSHDYLCLAWLRQPEDHVIAGTDSGSIAVFRAGEFVGNLAAPPPGTGSRVTALATSSLGFVAGLANGSIRYYALTADGGAAALAGAAAVPTARLFECTRTWKMDGAGPVASLALCPAEERVCVGTADNQLWTVSIAALPTGAAAAANAAAAAATATSSAAASNNGAGVAVPVSGVGAGGAAAARGDEPRQLTFSFHAPCYATSAAGAAGAAVGSGHTAANSSGGASGGSVLGDPPRSNSGAGAGNGGGALVKAGANAAAAAAAAAAGGTNGTNGAITGLDTCQSKPLAVTCGADRTVRIWNVLEQSLELCRAFADEPCGAAFHPTGLHLAIGFPDKLRLFNVFMGDLRPFRELPVKLCREARFSNGGHRLAAVNGHVISVYDFYTFDKICDLRGHNARVRHVSWAPHDLSLVSCGLDGAVYLWDPDDGKRLGEFVHKGVSFTGALAAGGSAAVFAVGNDRTLKELEAPELQVAKELDCGTTLSKIALTSAESAMLAGTAEAGLPGCVRAYTYPLTGDYQEYPCMGAPISRLCVTPDDRFLVVADEAGCVFVFDVRDRAGAGGGASGASGQERGAAAAAVVAAAAAAAGSAALSPEAVVPLPYSEEVLVTRADLDERAAYVAELQNKADELALHNEYQLRLRDMNYSEKMKEMSEKSAQDLEQGRNRHELLREETNEAQLEHEDRLRRLEERHQHAQQEKERHYQQRVIAEVERYQALVQERNMQQQRWADQQQLLVSTHARYLDELTADLERRLADEVAGRQRAEEDLAEAVRDAAEARTQLEDDVDTESEALRTRLGAQLAADREATLRFKGENGIMRKKFAVLGKDIEDQKEEAKTLHARERELQAQVRQLEKEVAAHKRDVKARDDAIGERERRVYELKRHNQELEKFKLVLDHKIKELRRQVEPREAEIGALRWRVSGADRELESFHDRNASLDSTIGDLRERLDAAQKRVLRQRTRLRAQEIKSRRAEKGLTEAAGLIQNPSALAAKVTALASDVLASGSAGESGGGNGGSASLDGEERGDSAAESGKNARAGDFSSSAAAAMDANVRHEYHRHREYLERSLTLLRQQFGGAARDHRRENAAAVRDNMLLVRDIAEQRERNAAATRMLQARANDLKRATAARRGRGGRMGGGAPAAASAFTPAAAFAATSGRRADPAPVPSDGAWDSDLGVITTRSKGDGGADDEAVALAALERNRRRIADLQAELGALVGDTGVPAISSSTAAAAAPRPGREGAEGLLLSAPPAIPGVS